MFSSKNRVKFSKIQIFQKTFSLFQGGRHYVFKFLRKQYWFLHRYSQNLQKNVAEGTSYRFDAIDPPSLIALVSIANEVVIIMLLQLYYKKFLDI